MSPKPGGTEDADHNDEIERFLKRWTPLPNDYEGCPPLSALVAVAKEPPNSAPSVHEDLANSAKQPDWTRHVAECAKCKGMIALLQQTERPKVTLDHIFARAGREAQQVRSKGRRSARIPAFSWSLDSPTFLNARPRSVMAFSVSVVLVAAVWFGVRQSEFFKTSDNIATVLFERNEPKELRQSLEETWLS